MGVSVAQTNPKPKEVTHAKQKAPEPVKHRTSKLAFDPADISVDKEGNVVIKDKLLASEVLKFKAAGGTVMDNGTCGAGCK
jgi:hypothetical protein